MPSISSMKMIDGAAALAWLNRSRTRLAPTPTIISTNSDAAIEKNGTSASPATARARRVFPVPGTPDNSTPRGMTAPSWVYLAGLRRKSTTSASSASASSMPATSSNVTRFSVGSYRVALLEPRPPSPPSPRPMRRKNPNSRRRIRSVGPKPKSSCCQNGAGWSVGSALTSTPWSVSTAKRSSSANSGRWVSNSVHSTPGCSGSVTGSMNVPWMVSPRAETSTTLPPSTSDTKPV